MIRVKPLVFVTHEHGEKRRPEIVCDFSGGSHRIALAVLYVLASCVEHASDYAEAPWIVSIQNPMVVGGNVPSRNWARLRGAVSIELKNGDEIECRAACTALDLALVEFRGLSYLHLSPRPADRLFEIV